MNVTASVTIPIKNIQLNPGSLITIRDVTWEQFEAILEEREAAGIRTRVAYSKGTLEIMSPLPAHAPTFDIYEALEVPEVWIYTEEKFTINVLTEGKYLESSISPTFSNLPILELIPQLVDRHSPMAAVQCSEN